MDFSGTYKLLIVDDEPEIGELLTYNFRKKGFDVMTASNGITGLKALEKFTPDLIILDIMMPYSEGIEMCRQVKKQLRFSLTPVLFLSATSNQYLIRSAIKAGGKKLISKPIHMNDLIREVVAMKDRN